MLGPCERGAAHPRVLGPSSQHWYLSCPGWQSPSPRALRAAVHTTAWDPGFPYRDCWKLPTSVCCLSLWSRSLDEQGGLTASASVIIAGADEPFLYGSGGAFGVQG